MDSKNFENRLFYNGQMDTDSSPEYVKNGSYGRAFNVRPYNSETGSVGVITNMQGNTLVEYDFGLYDGAFIRVIGSKLDLKRNRIYWFIYANTSDNIEKGYVLYYDYTTEDIVTVFEDPNEDFQKQNVLQFSKDGILKSVSILYDDDIGDTLLWTDAITEPKKLNVKAGINRFNSYTDNTTGFTVGQIVFANYSTKILTSPSFFIPCVCVTATNDYPTYDFTTGLLSTANFATLPIGDCYPPFIIKTLFYQKPITPRYSPIATFNYDTDESNQGAGTFLRRKSYQFCYKYVLFDGQETEWSPKSEAVLTQELTSGLFAAGETLASPDFPTPSSVSVKVPIMLIRALDPTDEGTVIDFPASMVQRVKIAIREVPNTKTPGDWYLFQDIDYSEFFNYNVKNIPIQQDFPLPGSPGTYFYNWDVNSYYWYNQDGSAAISITNITVEYNGTQTLIPIDILDASALFYNVPKSCIAQDVIDNRAVFGAGKFGMDVSKDVVKSIQDEITLFALAKEVDFDVESLTTLLFTYNSGGSTSIIDGGNTAQIVWTIDDFDVADLNTPFQFSFQIQVTITKSLLGVPFPPIVFDRTISGSFPSIIPGFANYNDLIEAQILAAFPDIDPAVSPSATTHLSVSANNTTGELTLLFEDQQPVTVIDSIDLAIIPTATNEGFFRFASYFPERTFKPFSTQQYGIVFGDDAGRLTTVIETESLKFQVGHFIQSALEPRKFEARISGLDDIIVPDEATTMHLVRKRSESYEDYIHFAISESNCPLQSWNRDVAYKIGFINLELDDISNTPEQNGPNKFYCTLNSVNGGDGLAYDSVFQTTILSFTPQAGDVFRFLYRMDEDGAIVETYDSAFLIDGYSELWNTISIDFTDIQDKEPYLADFLIANESPDGVFRIACEVTKGRDISQQEFYWEVAAQFSCSNGKVDVPTTGNNFTFFGDAYIKLRGYCVDYNANPTNVVQNFPVVDKNYNDFAPSNNVGEGRPNAIIKSIQRGQNIQSEVNRDNLITYSEQSIQNTDVKRYGTVYDANIQEVDNVFGRIELLHAEGDILDIYQEDKRSRVYSGRGITTELSGAERVIASQNNVFSDVIYQKGAYGISRDANSFSVNGYQRYYTDAKRGNVYRESMDGITVISEIGMSGYFKNLFKNYRNSYTTPIIRGIVDERVDEYILSVTYSAVFNAVLTEETTFLFLAFQIPSGISAFTDQIDSGDPILIDITPTGKFKPVEFSVNEQDSYGTVFVLQKPSVGSPVAGDTIRVVLPITETLVFSERTGGWTTFLSYKSEWLSNGIQSYHSFLDGQMYLHDIGNTDYNTFFGETFPSSFEVITNQNPQLTKFFLTVGVKTKFPSVEVEQGGVTTSEEQQSYIPNACFQNKEGTQWARLLGDGIGVEVNNGDRLRGRWLKVNVVLQEPEVNTELAKVLGVVFSQKVSGFSL